MAAAKNLSSYFEIIVENLDLQNKADKLIDDTLSDIIRTFKNHSSIMHIKEDINKNFHFTELYKR